MRKAMIVALAGATLSDDEGAYLAAERPAGVILFSRNCQTPEQLAALIRTVRTAIGTDDVLVAIDQEGGRVQRLKPPVWRRWPPAAAFGAWYEGDGAAAHQAAFLVARLMADELKALGITMNCAPVLDLPAPDAHGVIGNRALGRDPATVAALGRAFADGLAAGRVVPVIKHIPGHGRARADSHLELPVVDAPRDVLAATDFRPFEDLADAPAAMTAHVVYTAIDAAAPASISAKVVGEVIRRSVGFDGLLMSDDIGMNALAGTIEQRAAAVIASGTDLVLECSGRIDAMRAVAQVVPPLEGESARQFAACLEIVHRPRAAFDAKAAEAALAETLARSDGASTTSATSPVELV